MLRIIRIILAVLSLLAVTLLFLDFTGTAARLWPWMAKIQFIPALLSVNLVALGIVVVLTLLLGRVYCSVICPLGILQDVVNWVRCHTGSRKGRLRRLHFTPAWTRVRLGVLTAFAVLLVLGLTNVLAASVAGLIEPYSAYGRIASQIFAPGYDAANNLLASWSESQGNYLFYRVACAVSVPMLVVAILTLVVVTVMAWRGGRDYCNTVCPVGTVLGWLSRRSLLCVSIDTSKCIGCGKCARACKAKCIDSKHHAIDYSRCVVCMDCIGSCSEGAISYTLRRPAAKTEAKADGSDAPESKSRRGFVSATLMLAGSAAMNAIAKEGDGGLADLKDRQPHRRATRIVPAGAVSHRHLSQHCTACQLCIQSCPQHVLRPSTSLDTFMQPVVDYTEGWCDTTCTRCSQICPAGAFHPIDAADKTAIKVGTAVVDLDTCISAAGKACGNCSRHCPAGAISMVAVDPTDPRGARMPVVNDEACIGCGECEFFCPVGTVASIEASSSAIHIEGLEVHREI